MTLACIKFHEALLQPSPRNRPRSKDAMSQEWMQISINSSDDAEADAYQQERGDYGGTSTTIKPPAIVRHESIPYRTTGSSSSKDRYVPRQADDGADDAVSTAYAPTSSSGSVADPMKRSATDMDKVWALKPSHSGATSPESQCSPVPSTLSSYALSRTIGQPLENGSPQPFLASRVKAASNDQGPSRKSATQIVYEAAVATSHRDFSTSLASRDENSSLPPGWEHRHTETGRSYFIDHISRTTSWIRPERQSATDVASQHDRRVSEVRTTPAEQTLPEHPNLRVTGRPYILSRNIWF